MPLVFLLFFRLNNLLNLKFDWILSGIPLGTLASYLLLDGLFVKTGNHKWALGGEGVASTPATASQEDGEKRLTRRDQLHDFLANHGPATRQKIAEKTGIPLGTLGAYLQEDGSLVKDSAGQWSLAKKDGACKFLLRLLSHIFHFFFFRRSPMPGENAKCDL